MKNRLQRGITIKNGQLIRIKECRCLGNLHKGKLGTVFNIGNYGFDVEILKNENTKDYSDPDTCYARLIEFI